MIHRKGGRLVYSITYSTWEYPAVHWLVLLQQEKTQPVQEAGSLEGTTIPGHVRVLFPMRDRRLQVGSFNNLSGAQDNVRLNKIATRG